MKRVLLWFAVIALIGSSTSVTASAAVKAGGACTKVKATTISNGYKYTCIKSGKKLIWSKGVKVVEKVVVTPTPSAAPTPSPSASPTPSPTPSASQVVLPEPRTQCPKIGMKITGSTGYVRCMWAGHANNTEQALKNLLWSYFPLVKLSTSQSNNYEKTPKENESCRQSGDTFDIANGKLECRWINGYKLQWIKINTVKKLFTNAKSPVSIEVCKLKNSDSKADRTGRNAGAGVVGFPLAEPGKYRLPEMYVKGVNEVLIVPVDFSDIPGGDGVLTQLEYDKKWLTDWYDYFSNGQSKFKVTTINRWFRMEKSSPFYPTDSKTINANGDDSNMRQGNQAQAFIDEITKEVDLRKFSTIYLFYPDGTFSMGDLIVRSHLFKIKEGETYLNFFSWGRNLEGMETLKWSYYIHETLHDFNIIGHAPGNGWPLGMMTNQSGISYAINPYEQFLFDWLPADQIYCDNVETLKPVTISLSPVEREDKQTKMAIIKLSLTKAIVVESHGVDKWSSLKFGDREFPPGFYSVMAYVVDLDKAVAPPGKSDSSSTENDEWAWAVWQKVAGGPSNRFNRFVGDGKDLANYIAVLGDSFLIEGIKITVVGTGDYETVKIEKVS